MKKYQLRNLDCASCAARIEENLKKLEDVKFVNVSFANSTMTIDTSNIERVKSRIKEIESKVEVLNYISDNTHLISKNDFSEIAYSSTGDVLYQFWFKASEHMSKWEFQEQMNTLLSTAEILKSKVLYIDAYDFCYPISDSLMKEIKEQLNKCKIKLTGIVLSSNILGKLNILKLIKNISPIGITLTVFKTSEEGESWASLKTIE